MLLWSMRPANERHEQRKYNVFYATGYSNSEVGITTIIERFCEWVRDRSSGIINVSFEAIETTWICVDKLTPDVERSVAKHLAPAFSVSFLTVYPPMPGSDQSRRHDYFAVTASIHAAERCPLYSDDRDLFAARLVPLVHRAWEQAWQTADKVEGHARRRWPVKMWVHGKPEQVWEVDDGGRLIERPDHPPVDESIIDPVSQ